MIIKKILFGAAITLFIIVCFHLSTSMKKNDNTAVQHIDIIANYDVLQMTKDIKSITKYDKAYAYLYKNEEIVFWAPYNDDIIAVKNLTKYAEEYIENMDIKLSITIEDDDEVDLLDSPSLTLSNYEINQYGIVYLDKKMYNMCINYFPNWNSSENMDDVTKLCIPCKLFHNESNCKSDLSFFYCLSNLEYLYIYEEECFLNSKEKEIVHIDIKERIVEFLPDTCEIIFVS